MPKVIRVMDTDYEVIASYADKYGITMGEAVQRLVTVERAQVLTVQPHPTLQTNEEVKIDVAENNRETGKATAESQTLVERVAYLEGAIEAVKMGQTLEVISDNLYQTQSVVAALSVGMADHLNQHEAGEIDPAETRKAMLEALKSFGPKFKGNVLEEVSRRFEPLNVALPAIEGSK